MPDIRTQAVTGVETQGEAKIRERWPSVARFAVVANVGRLLTRTIILAPMAWLVMAPFYFSKVLPLCARRYTLTNQRVKILGGWSGKVIRAVALKDIDEVNVRTDANSTFFRTGNLDILSDGKVVLTLAGTPEPDSFQVAILNARNAWVPEKAKTLPFVPANAE